MAVISLTDYRPLPRSDGDAWKEARLEGANNINGPWTAIETFTLTPVDADPAHPASRDFTTEDATDEQSWVRVVFIDDDSNEQATPPVQVASVPGPRDLTTLKQVREAMGKQNTETAQDFVIQSFITSASDAVSRYCQRQFIAETNVSKTFEWDQTGAPRFVDLAPYELSKLDSVTLDVDSDSPVVLSDEDFRLWPKPNPDGTYLALRLNPLGISPTASRWGSSREVTVKGDWGMAAVPADVAHWTTMTVVIWMRRDVSAFSTTYNLDEGHVERPQMLPSAVMAGLDQWKRGRP